MSNELVSVKQRAEELFNLTEELKNDALDLNLHSYELARKLYLIQEKGLYRYYDSSHRWSFEAWLAQSEVPISYETARKWIRIYQVFIKEKGLDPKTIAEISSAKLMIIMGVVQQEKKMGSVIPLLEQAKILSRGDLIRAIKQKGLDIGGCEHLELEEVVSFKCKSCGEWFKKKPGDKLDRDQMSVEIDRLIVEFCEKTELHEPAESRSMSRRYARLLLLKYKREDVTDCLDWLLADKWWVDKLTRLSQLFRKMPEYLREGKTITESV